MSWYAWFLSWGFVILLAEGIIGALLLLLFWLMNRKKVTRVGRLLLLIETGLIVMFGLFLLIFFLDAVQSDTDFTVKKVVTFSIFGYFNLFLGLFIVSAHRDYRRFSINDASNSTENPGGNN